jgi:hypothetical protein
MKMKKLIKSKLLGDDKAQPSLFTFTDTLINSEEEQLVIDSEVSCGKSRKAQSEPTKLMVVKQLRLFE